MHDTFRTFIAVETNETARSRAEELIGAFRGAGADVKWVDRRNMHITLKFLGEVPTDEIPRLCEVVKNVAGNIPPFELQLRGAGAFPRPNRPSTVWLGVVDDAKQSLASLHRQVETALAKLGHAKEGRRFEPHLTLGRVRDRGPAVAELGRLLKLHAEFDAGYFPISEVVVFSSQLTPKGPIYTPLCRAGLKGSLEARYYPGSKEAH